MTTSHPPPADFPCTECGGTGRSDDEFSRRGAELAGLPPDICIPCGGTGLLVLDDEYLAREDLDVKLRLLGARARLLDEARYHLGASATEDEVQALADNLERHAQLLGEARERLGPTATEDEVQAFADDLLPYDLPRNQRLMTAVREYLGPTATEDEVQALADHRWRLWQAARRELGPNATEDEVLSRAVKLSGWLRRAHERLDATATDHELQALADDIRQREQQLRSKTREQLGPTATEEDVRRAALGAETLLDPSATDDEVRAVVDALSHATENDEPAARKERNRAMLSAIANNRQRAYEDEDTWYGRLRDMLFTVVFLGAVAFGAAWTLVEPWSTYAVQAAFWLALLALLHGVRLLSAIRRAFPAIIGSGLLFLFGQVAVHERFQEPFVFWPVVIAVGAVLYEHDLGHWIREKWAARGAREQDRKDGV